METLRIKNLLRINGKQSPNPPKNKFGPQSQNLGSVVRGFKIGVTKYAHQNNYNFEWQSRFYDRIIRDAKELNRIRRYIKNNPVEWVNDEFNS